MMSKWSNKTITSQLKNMICMVQILVNSLEVTCQEVLGGHVAQEVKAEEVSGLIRERAITSAEEVEASGKPRAVLTPRVRDLFIQTMFVIGAQNLVTTFVNAQRTRPTSRDTITSNLTIGSSLTTLRP